MAQFTIRMPLDEHLDFKVRAVKLRKPMNDIALEAIRRYLPELESATAAAAPSLQETPVAAKG